MKHPSVFAVAAAMAACSLLLAACGSGLQQPAPREVAPPQAIYRIDENRYFELVPNSEGACSFGSVFYIDKAQGIRSLVVRWDGGVMNRAAFTIDAANEQYLVGPTTRGNTDCSSGGGGCGGARMPYSKDGGRTWPRVSASSPTDDIDLRGPRVFARDRFRSWSVDLATSLPPKLVDWDYAEDRVIPPPRKAPLDTKIHCTANGKE